MNVVQKSVALLGRERRKLPGMVLLFLFISVVDVLGLGLMGPFVALVMDPEKQLHLSIQLGNYLDTNLTADSAMIIVGGTLICLFIVRFFIAVGSNALVISFSESQRLRLKHRLLLTYLSMSSQISNKRNTGEYIHLIHTLTGYYSANVLYFMLKFLSETIVCVAIIGLLANQSFIIMAALVCLLAITYFGWDSFTKGPLKSLGSSINQLSGQALSQLRENFDGYEELKVLGKSKQFADRFYLNSKQLFKKQTRAAIFGSVPRYLLELIIMLFIVLVGTFSFIFTDNFSDLIPSLAIFAVAAVRLLPSAQLLAHAIVVIRHNTNSVDLLYDDYVGQGYASQQMEKEREDAGIDKFNDLVIDDLDFAFDGQSQNVLKGINLTIKAGQSVGIIGESGSGKSTLANLILGLLDPVQGSIFVNGKDIAKCIVAWQSHLAYIPQQIFLLDASIETNISLEFDQENIDQIRLDSALEKASVKDFVHSLPRGVKTEIGEKGAFLSGGQRQRLITCKGFLSWKRLPDYG